MRILGPTADPATRRTSDAAAPRPLVVAAAWSWRLLVVAAAVAAVVLALRQLSVVLLPAVTALFLTAVLAPPVGWLTRLGWRRSLAAPAVMGLALLIVLGMFTGLGWTTAAEADRLDVNVSAGVDEVERRLVEDAGLPAERVADVRAQVEDAISPETLRGGVASGASAAIEVLAGTLITLVLTFFFLRDGGGMWRWLLRTLTASWRPHVDEAGTRAWTVVGGWVRGTAIVATVDAVLIGAAVVALGVPLAAPLIVLTFLAAFIPIVGAIAAGAAAVLVALATQGTTDALILLGVILLVQQLEGNVLQPLVMGRTLGLHPVVILIAVAAGATLWGIAGAFLAVPTVAALRAVGGYVHGYLTQRRAIVAAGPADPAVDPEPD